jgi:DNA-binding CsgD family transcriptional regulator
VLAVEQILARLADRFALLTGGGRAALPRQQTLLTTIDWSYDLLTGEEQRLLHRLSVFAGRFTVDDVEAVFPVDGGSGSAVLDLLAALVDKSLVMREDASGIASYRLHETMREYAGVKLRDAGEAEHLDDVFVEHYRTQARDRREALLRDIRAAPGSPDKHPDRTLEWLAWVELELDNIRSALHTCLAGSDWRRGLEIATSIGYYWVTRGTSESIRWFDDLLAVAGESPDVPVRAFYFRGWLSVLKGDPGAAAAWLDRAIAAASGTGQITAMSESLSVAATAQAMAGDRAAARRLLEQADAITHGLDHYPASMALLQAQAVIGLLDGELAAAEAASLEGVRMSREVGDLFYLERMLMNLGLAATAAGDLPGSRTRFIEGLRIATQTDNRLGQSSFLCQLGGLAAASGQPRLGARLLGAAESLGSAAGASTTGPFGSELARVRDVVRMAAGAAKFEAEYAAGTRLDRESALRLALGDIDDGGVTAEEHVETGPLSKREVEVARLIADGLGNKEIAARLFISERTVTTHVGNILNKLGFDSRVQVARWIATSDS